MEPLLRWEHLEIVGEISFKANPLNFLEGVNVAYIPSSHGLKRLQDVNENEIAALDVVFSFEDWLPQGQGSYHVPLSFYDSVDFSKGV